ncbi:faeA-like family protein [Serratia fonticola]|uniref:faeA-like family protein n=1 Tax=Serratia fonticola TaxID=47917 RepID=UPI00211C3FBD|nr:faeA-like family protein [Serratia fonticola]
MENQGNEIREREIERVLIALQVLCNLKCSSGILPPQELWPKTRHIANFCDMDIYTSRRYLMKLVRNNKVYMSDGLINNSLRWYIVAPFSLPYESEIKQLDILPQAITKDVQLNEEDTGLRKVK